MIETAEEVAAFVRAAKYPPIGNRSFGPIRAGLRGGADYFDRANEQIVTFAMIETKAALDNLEAIAAVPGLDGLYIGPFDLTVSLGFPEQANFSDPNLMAIIDQVIAVAKKQQLFTGIFTVDPTDGKAMVAKGFNLVTCGTDGVLFNQIAKSWLADLKE
jgi:4-hydroxy-2-oxoheptanedioate aldolase